MRLLKELATVGASSIAETGQQSQTLNDGIEPADRRAEVAVQWFPTGAVEAKLIATAKVT